MFLKYPLAIAKRHFPLLWWESNSRRQKEFVKDHLIKNMFLKYPLAIAKRHFPLLVPFLTVSGTIGMINSIHFESR